MKLAHFTSERSSVQRLGILVGQRVVDVAALAASVGHAGEEPFHWLPGVTDILEVIARGDEALAEIGRLVAQAVSRGAAEEESLSLPLEAVIFLPPVYPGKIVAIGRNYVDHAIEGGDAPPAAPLIFTKLPNSLSSHNAPIVLPVLSAQVVYEAELAVVIGRRATRVSETDTLNYVFSYTLINDGAPETFNSGDGQWVAAKGSTGSPRSAHSLRRATRSPMHALNIEGRLNGEVMRSSNTVR
jgi:2-keto-4-pentenoate hydratase/2-oxohepta-3-ene-1,7-dioic acid hydratase in catechol pathway